MVVVPHKTLVKTLVNYLTKETPSPLSRVLGAHKSSPEFDGHFHYQSVIGKLNYLEKCSRPDIAYATHQCARFSSDPRKEHGEAVKWLGRHLRATRDKGICIRPTDDAFKVWADADFSGNWIPEEAEEEPDTAPNLQRIHAKLKMHDNDNDTDCINNPTAAPDELFNNKTSKRRAGKLKHCRAAVKAAVKATPLADRRRHRHLAVKINTPTTTVW